MRKPKAAKAASTSKLKEQRNCEHCNKTYLVYRKVQRFCSVNCRVLWHHHKNDLRAVPEGLGL